MNLSLLDAFRPKWQNSNPERRLEAVEEMDIQEQSVLERIALSDENSSVRSAAVKKLTLIPSLSAISKKDNEAGIRRLAETRYFEEVTKMLKIFREPANEEVLSFVNELKDTRYAEELARSMPSSELRMELIKNTGKVNVLVMAATKDAKEEIAKAAVERIESEPSLVEVSKKSKHNSVQKIANEKLRARRDAEDNGKKAAALLAGKRHALIQQAHHLAAEKDPFSVKSKFDSLMEEAKALGMGSDQATLDEIFASYTKFLNEADTERIAAEKAAAEKAEQQLHLGELLAELEAILDAGEVSEKANRVSEITAEWNEKKSIMDADSVKRFNLALVRTQEAKKPEPEAAEEIASEEAKARPQLLEMFQALADSDITESTSKHLHALVREWEKFPALEGDDPLLQSYNALRNKLKEKITAFEWKTIVGEQKFKYHDLWLEYKSATERFQEMRQWESWHNENDRANILEEMEMLAKEPGSQDVLNKLREYSNKWKNIGPVSPTKFVEFRDKFQALFEQIKQNCAPFIEERMADRHGAQGKPERAHRTLQGRL